MDLILRISLKSAENGYFWAQMESFDRFFHPKCDIKIFAVIYFRESAISHVFANFNFVKMAKNREIAKFNLAKINNVLY